jgi:hypothetical protein
MSTTFEVYPSSLKPPSFRDVQELAQVELWRFLERRDLQSKPVIRAVVLQNETHEPRAFDPDGPAVWPQDSYAWFTVGHVVGGTDAYVRPLSAEDRGYLAEQVGDARLQGQLSRSRRYLSSHYYWSFRRSAGQPGIINLAYGIVAASFALLTEGLIFSDDSAWEAQRFPAEPGDFLRWYFDPDSATEENYREWSARCILGLKAELLESG